MVDLDLRRFRPSEKSLLEVRRALQQLLVWQTAGVWGWKVVRTTGAYNANFGELVLAMLPCQLVFLPEITAESEGLGVCVLNHTNVDWSVWVQPHNWPQNTIDHKDGELENNEYTPHQMGGSVTYISDGNNNWLRVWHWHSILV